MPYLLLAAALLGLVPQVPLTLRVEDASGARLKDELVIVQDLNAREREVLRALTDQNGNVPVPDLKPGLYRAIATSPYGLWETEIREFLVEEGSPLEVVLKVRPMPTHGYGDIVTVGAPQSELRVLGSTGLPVSRAAVLVRDRNATPYLERWYQTDAKGLAKIELTSSPTIVVVVYQNKLTVKEISEKPATIVIHLPRS